ncbi:hypothetical protein ACOMHN_035213 [Nucella lapillus]
MATVLRGCRRLASVAVSQRVFPALVSSKRCIKIGDPLPDVTLYETSPDNAFSAGELYKGKKGIIFAVMAAFSPGCTKAHIPDFLAFYEKFKEEGYIVSCISVNDPYVMDAWGKFTHADGKIHMLADPQGEFTRAMGMEIECKNLLGTNRSQKYSLVVEDGIIRSINVDPEHTGLTCLLCIQTIKNFNNKT